MLEKLEISSMIEVSNSAAPTHQSHYPTRKHVKRLTNAELHRYAVQNGQPLPIFAWKAHLGDLPPETFEHILSFCAFEVVQKDRKSSYERVFKKAKKNRQSHMLNSLAAVSKGARIAVELYCAWLTTTYVKNRQHQDNDDDRIPTVIPEPSEDPKSFRGKWLQNIGCVCIFCFRDLARLQIEEPELLKCAQNTNDHNAHDLGLYGALWQPKSLVCRKCDLIQWPESNIISRDQAVVSFGMPEYFLNFPPVPLQTARYYHKSLDVLTIDYFLANEVAAVRDLVRSNPAKYVPAFITQMPEFCLEDIPEEETPGEP